MDRKNFSDLNRLEEKYVVNKGQALVIKRIVEKYLEPSYLDDSTAFTFIKSTYFDSRDLAFYRNHLDQKDNRIKVRMRQYGPNGSWRADETYLEIKEKDEQDTFKSRICLNKDTVRALKEGKEVRPTAELYEINKDLHTKRSFTDFVFRINNLIRAYKLRPVVSISYKRFAYQKGKVRVTIDTNISYRSENGMDMLQAVKLGDLIDWDTAKKYGDKYNPDKNAIVEIKYEKDSDKDDAPRWLEDMLTDLDLESEKFSKYAWSMFKLLTKLLLY